MNENPLEKADLCTAKPASNEVPLTRRPYAAPRLTAFGTVSALTGGGSGLMQEGAPMTSMTRFP